MCGKHLVIGICGGTGSGKTTLAYRIERSLGEDAVLISMDSYYKDNHDMPFEERKKINYDHPDAFDVDMMISQVETLKNGGAVDVPCYDFSTHLRTNETVHVESRRVIILEGILLFAVRELLPLLDVKLYVDTDADVRILRRLSRDVKERGRSLDSVIDQYLNTVKPMHEAFIEPSKRLADVIIPEGGHNEIAYRMIIADIRHRIAK
ncbi:MAG: uridine kinase [Lachnospiraceae bacterium]|nr:uridine kinase [Lachnospiraceae bacterium]